MRIRGRTLFVALCLSAIAAPPATAALYRRALTIDRTGLSALTNIQAYVSLTPGNFDYGHVDPAGALFRFTDTDGTTPLTMFRETWNPGGRSLFWVKVPSIPAGSIKTIYMYHATSSAHIDETISDFPSTFPNRFQLAAGGNAFMSGSQTYDWVELSSGAVVEVPPAGAGVPLVITARRVIMNGTIQANGRGYGPGLGLGSGQAGSENAGAGGAGYGGAGGGGGVWFGPPTGGGTTYGTSQSPGIEMGSAGGASVPPLSVGGAGGGAVTIVAQRLDFGGVINANGTPGGDAGGGGSGGGVQLAAYDLRANGTILADGGSGGAGWDFYLGGGGGAGGRIKCLSENAMESGPPTLYVRGALGGSDGTGGTPAAPGAAGTTHVGMANFPDEGDVRASVGPEVGLVGVEYALEGGRVGHPQPNPARGGVSLRLQLDRPAGCRGEIVDLQGRLVRTLLSEELMPPGAHELAWDLRDEKGRTAPVGVYLARVTVGRTTLTRRIVVVR